MSDIILRLDDDMVAWLDDMARRTERPRQVLIEEALHNYVELQDWQIRKIEEGIAAADRGETDEEMDRIFGRYEIGTNGASASADPYLASVSALLSEWDSPEDAEAYDGL